MKPEAKARRIRIAAVATVATLILANLGLTFAVIREASARKIVLMVPGIRTPREATVGEPPPEVVRDFAYLYLAYFDTYTPATVEEGTRHLEAWLSPRFFSQAASVLNRRKELVAQSRMAGQILLPRREEAIVRRTEGGDFEVSLVALRRVYIADRLQSETSLAYTVGVEPGTPTAGNPYGLYVTGQLIGPKGGEHGVSK